MEPFHKVARFLHGRIEAQALKTRFYQVFPCGIFVASNTSLSVDNGVAGTKPHMGIALAGFIGSGKSTAGEYLVKKYHFQRLAFADPLKDITAYLFGLPRDLLQGDTPESRAWREEFISDFNHTPRELLQLLGTDVCRFLNDAIWLDLLMLRCRAERIVVEDGRFVNELDMLRANGFITCRLVRDQPEEETSIRHISETAHLCHDFDHVLNNNGDLQSLIAQLDTMLLESQPIIEF
jgi:hypothetical protein